MLRRLAECSLENGRSWGLNVVLSLKYPIQRDGEWEQHIRMVVDYRTQDTEVCFCVFRFSVVIVFILIFYVSWCCSVVSWCKTAYTRTCRGCPRSCSSARLSGKQTDQFSR